VKKNGWVEASTQSRLCSSGRVGSLPSSPPERTSTALHRLALVQGLRKKSSMKGDQNVHYSFYLLVVIALLVVTACAPQVMSTPISSTATLASTMEASPTLKPTITLEASPTLIPTATLFEDRLLFSRFTEATHTFNGLFVAQPDGSAETEVPLPWTEGGGRWSRSGKEIAVPTLLADGRVGTAIIAPDGTVLRTFEIPHPTLNLVCFVWTRDDANQSLNGIYTVRSSDGGDLQRLTSAPAGMNDEPGDYSPDGQLVFIRVTGPEPPGLLLLINQNGGEPHPLSKRPMGDTGRVSPDGRLVVTSADGQLLIIDLDGKIVHTISIDGYFLFGPVSSPDGSRIAFSLTTPGVYAAEIYTSLPDGTDLQRVTNTADNEINVELAWMEAPCYKLSALRY
jgi:hypothetical protein